MSLPRFELKSTTSPKRVEIVGTVVAGRNPESDLVLTDGHPSRRHARLFVSDEKVWVEDLGSANGTFVNGQKIVERVALSAGDRVRFDAEEYELRAVVAADDQATRVRLAGASDAADVAPHRGRTPGSWADPELREGQGTRLFDPAELENMRGGVPVATAAAVDEPHLVVQSGRRAGSRLKLKPGRAANLWEVGSDPSRDIVLDDAGVSAFHAKIVNEGKRWKLIDQMSANGSFVNGQKANISYLKSGDRLRFGPVECAFQLPEAAVSAVAARGMSPRLIAAIAFAITAGLIIVGMLLFG